MQASRRCAVAAVRLMTAQRSSALRLSRPAGVAMESRLGFATTASNPNFDPYSNKQMSDAVHRIAQVPVIEVDGNVATCNGGGGALGHPIEYIDIDTRNLHKPQTCKYCGLRFIKKGYLDKSSQH